ncbi:hypothetical protein [Frankia sp. Cas3]|uniref:hypothetical protein n=1 Tax=Frankia sp. Cas3 TaxID=3073926 RepID=UPI002AD3D289|nr:hypothetical protein [Frankia sp. Cas3]
MTAVAVNRDPVAQKPQDRPLGRPLDITGLVEWPLPVGRVDFDEGLAYLHAVDPGGYTTDHLDQATTDHRPPTTDHRPPTTDHRPPTTDHRP